MANTRKTLIAKLGVMGAIKVYVETLHLPIMKQFEQLNEEIQKCK